MSRYEHWKSKIKPMSGKFVTVPFMAHFVAEEAQRAKQGLIPEGMDDKWVGFWSEDSVSFYRSWTGHQIYRLPIASHGAGFSVGPLDVVDDSAIYRRSGDSVDQDMVVHLLSQLTGRKEPNQPPEPTRG